MPAQILAGTCEMAAAVNGGAAGMPTRIAPADNVNHLLCAQPLPFAFFYPQQKTNGPHSVLFGWGVNYSPLPHMNNSFHTMVLSGLGTTPLPALSLLTSPAHTGSCGGVSIDTSTPDLCMKQLKALHDKECVISSSRLNPQFALNLIVCPH